MAYTSEVQTMPAGESATEPVLKALAGNTIPVNPTILEWYIGQQIEYRAPTRTTIENALHLLEDRGLVENPFKSYYRLTDAGRDYVTGALDE